MNYVIGIDGGGTKTKAVLANTNGEILADIQSGISNFQRVGPEGVTEVCLDVLEQCQHKCSIKKETILH